jgi:membrane fusion protein, multidrug efflux system
MKQTTITVFLLAFLLTFGCSRDNTPAEAGTQKAGRGGRGGAGRRGGGAALVTTATVTSKSVPVEIRVVGSVEAYSTIRVRAQITGQLVKVLFQEGQDVKAGDLLFQLDPRPYEETIRQAEANLARNTALLRQAEANLKRDMAQEKFAKEQAARYLKLFSEGVMSKQQADQYASEFDVRSEAVQADRAAIESAQASIRADKALLENAHLQRAYCEIRSPLDARAGDLLVEEGNLVRVNDAELVTLKQIRPIYVTFTIPENRLTEINKYARGGTLAVLATPSGDAGPPEAGKLSFIDNTVDITTGTIRLKGTFGNQSGKLWPGQFVNVVLRLTTMPGAVVVPARALQMSQNGEYAYVVGKDMTAEMRPVKTGLRFGEEVVVESGLQPGEIVVSEGQLRLAPGMTVRTRGGRGA